MSLLTLRGLFERLRAPSQSQKGHFSEKTKLKKWHQNSWHWQKSAQSSEIFVTSRGICRGVGVSSRKGDHFPFWSELVRTKKKPGYNVLLLLTRVLLFFMRCCFVASHTGWTARKDSVDDQRQGQQGLVLLRAHPHPLPCPRDQVLQAQTSQARLSGQKGGRQQRSRPLESRKKDVWIDSCDIIHRIICYDCDV